MLSIPLSLTPQQAKGLCERFAVIYEGHLGQRGMREHEYRCKKLPLPRQVNTDQKNIGEEGQGPARPADPGVWGPIFPVSFSSTTAVPPCTRNTNTGDPPCSGCDRLQPRAIGSCPSRGRALGTQEVTSGPCCDTGPVTGRADPRLGPDPPQAPGSPPRPGQTSRGHCLRGEQEERNPRGPHYSHTEG